MTDTTIPAFDEGAALAAIRAEQTTPKASALPTIHGNSSYAFSEQTAQAALKVTTLPPHERGAVETALREYAPGPERDAAEARMVRERIEGRTRVQNATRVLQEAARFGNLVAAEKLALNEDIERFTEERERIFKEMQTIIRHDTVTDPQTGQPKAVPVRLLTDAQMVARAARVAELDHHLRLLDGGAEWSRRVELAEQKEVSRRRTTFQRQQVEAEARRMAEKEAIRRQAEKLVPGMVSRLSVID